jgi:putative addiction module killer protein
MIVEAKKIELYKTSQGTVPYREWVSSIGSSKTRGRIDTRIANVRLGLLGVCKPVGGGVTELKLDFGPGYRIYIGQEGSNVVILLCGGDKSTQKGDIKIAKKYWADYKLRAQKARSKEWEN